MALNDRKDQIEKFEFILNAILNPIQPNHSAIHFEHFLRNFAQTLIIKDLEVQSAIHQAFRSVNRSNEITRDNLRNPKSRLVTYKLCRRVCKVNAN